jgi:tRNA G18 (ribose-2'-O)-methylase SpoU
MAPQMVHKKTTDELKAERPAPEELATLPRTPFNLLADNLRSLDNVGLLFRLAEGARLQQLYLTGYTGYPSQASDPRPESIAARHDHRLRKTAVYAVPHQPWTYAADPVLLVQQLKNAGQLIIALEQTQQSEPYHQVEASRYRLPATLMLGHEREGIRPELLSLADLIIDIPILGLGNSHNVALAAGIVTYHILVKTGQL